MIRIAIKFTFLLLAAIAALVLWQRAQLAVFALVRIDPLPDTRALIAEERYAEAADHLGFFMAFEYVNNDPDAQALEREIAAKRAGLRYQTGKLAEGVLAGTSDEPIGQAAGVITDFLVIGDLRDLALQGVHLARGEETDGVLVALSTIGLIATGAQMASGGATVASAGAAAPAVAVSTAAKSSIALLKTARKLGALPPWLGRSLVASAKTARETRSLAAVTDVLADTRALLQARGGFKLLSKTTSAASLKRMASFTASFGPQSATLYRIGGELVVDAASRAGKLGKDAVPLAATFGRGGLRVLDNLGALRFAKYSARASKVAYKGDAARLVARWLIRIPDWVLLTIALVAVAACIPWRALSRLGVRPNGGRAEPPARATTLSQS
ncbi:MAG: hypothetical protein ABI589_02785 [Burkholderiales bacterium]